MECSSRRWPDQIAIGMGDINQGAQQSAAGAQQSQQAAQDLTLLGESLMGLVKQYRLYALSERGGVVPCPQGSTR